MSTSSSLQRLQLLLLRRAHVVRCCVLGAITLLIVLTSTTTRVSAQVGVAQSLFEEGRRLLKEGKTSEACARFAESWRLERLGVTLLNLAACHRDEGKTASAWVEFRQAQAISERDGQSARAQEAKTQSEQLERRLSYIIFDASWSHPGESVKLDTTPLSRAIWATPRPLDPGDHKVEVTATNAISYTLTINVPPGPKTTHILLREPVMTEAKPGTNAPTADAANATKQDTQPGGGGGGGSGSKGRMTLEVALGGVGVVGLGVGAAFGLLAVSKNEDVKTLCPNDACPSTTTQKTAVDTVSSAHTFARVSNITIVAGTALVVASLVLLLTTPRAQPASRRPFELVNVGLVTW